MRILYVMSCRGWSSDAYRAGRVARELEARGHKVTFVARAGTEQKVLSRLRAMGIQDLRTVPLLGRSSPLGTTCDLLAIRRWLEAYDILHVHRGKEHWLGALANHLARHPVPLIRTRHILMPVRTHALNRWLYGRATDHVITVSHTIRESYLASGLLEPWRVTAIPGGVDHRKFHPNVDGAKFRRAHGLSANTPVVGVLAGLRSMKGHRTLLEAARLVVSARSEARFLLVGDGPQAAHIRRLVGQLGLEQTTVMVGFVPEPERALAAFNVAVYPSYSSEGMGRVLFEYMSMGLPIVASRVGLAPEVLTDQETALVVPPGQPDQLAGAIETFLNAPSLATETGQKCRRLVEDRYSGAVLAEMLEGLYRASIASKEKGSHPA